MKAALYSIVSRVMFVVLCTLAVYGGGYLLLDYVDKINVVDESCEIPELLTPGTLVNVKSLGIGSIISVDRIECNDVFYQVEFKNTCAIIPRTQMEVVLTFEIKTRT